MTEPLMASLPRLLLAAVIILLLIAAWIVLPPLDRRIFPLAVGAPELSLWLLLCGIAIGVVVVVTSQRGALRSITIGLAVAATVIAAVPLVRMPFAIRRFDDRMRGALGPNALSTRPGMRPAPVVLSELLTGVKPRDTRIDRGIVFAVHGGETLTLDVYRPAAPGRNPTVVQIYGGSWQRGPAVFLDIPWAEHGFDAAPHGPSGQLSLYYTERFLSWAFDRPAAEPR